MPNPRRKLVAKTQMPAAQDGHWFVFILLNPERAEVQRAVTQARNPIVIIAGRCRNQFSSYSFCRQR
jgi:hypothetical protein